MRWHIQYRRTDTEYIERHPSPELAIESACRLIEDGFDVHGIGTGPLENAIDKDQIARIYLMWLREKRPAKRLK